MLKFLLGRAVLANFREPAIVHAKFVVGGGGAAAATFTLKSSSASANFPMTLVRSGVGLLTLTVGVAGVNAIGGVRNLALLNIEHVVVAGADASASYQNIRPRPAFVESTGVIGLRVLTNAGVAGGEMAFTNLDEVHVTLYLDK